MNKSVKIVIGVLAIIVIICAIAIFAYSNREMSKDIENKKENYDLVEPKELGRIVKVNGKLYYDTGKESTITARCGNFDGQITSNVATNEVPMNDNESNFEGNYGFQSTGSDTIELKIDNKWIVFERNLPIVTALTLEDEIEQNTIWCGTFQLIWNDLVNDLAKQDIKFTPQLKVAENLNKQTFTANSLSDKYYYKKYGTPTLELKKEIEKAIKSKFNEKSDILDDFEWVVKDPKDIFLYAMLKKEFKFEKAFEEFEKGSFKNYSDISYFGIKEDSESAELRNQVTVLYYNTKDDFAIKLKTKQEDEIVLCKNPEGNTFNEIYKKITEKSTAYEGYKSIREGEILKIPNIKINEKTEFSELQEKTFSFANGDEYEIEKALQTIQFELDKTGGKIKSEAGMMVRNESAIMINNIREFVLDNTFAIFLQEEGKEAPYFAAKINDITKFQ